MNFQNTHSKMSNVDALNVLLKVADMARQNGTLSWADLQSVVPAVFQISELATQMLQDEQSEPDESHVSE
jgi:hypothetical protein